MEVTDPREGEILGIQPPSQNLHLPIDQGAARINDFASYGITSVTRYVKCR